MRIGLYTFGGPTIGTGHLFRCVALAGWLERLHGKNEIFFEVIDLDPSGDQVAKDVLRGRSDLPCRFYRDPALPRRQWDVLIVDRLNVDPLIAADLRSRTSMMVSIDDTGPGRFEADVALNPLYRSQVRTPAVRRPDFIDLQGPEYQIIAPAFTDAASVWRDAPEHLLITQGGADRHALTPPLIDALQPLLARYPALTIHIITGPAFRAEAGLRPYLERLGSRLVRHSDVSDMPGLLRKMDLAVCSAGVAPFELAAVGLPAVLITGEAKEIETAEQVATTGAAVTLGLYTDSSRRRLLDEVERLMASPEQRSLMRRAGLTRLSGRMGGDLIAMIADRMKRNSWKSARLQ